MAGSLQDQLLKAGLVSDQQLRERRRKKHKQRKKGAAKGQQAGDDISLAKAYSQRAQQEKADHDRELNRRREEARRRKEIKARLRQIIIGHAMNDKQAEIARHFEHNAKIRKIYLTAEQQAGLNAGRLGIAYFAGRYYLLDAGRIARVAEVEPSAVALLLTDTAEESEVEDGYYAQFKVPDDLMW